MRGQKGENTHTNNVYGQKNDVRPAVGKWQAGAGKEVSRKVGQGGTKGPAKKASQRNEKFLNKRIASYRWLRQDGIRFLPHAKHRAQSGHRERQRPRQSSKQASPLNALIAPGQRRKQDRLKQGWRPVGWQPRRGFEQGESGHRSERNRTEAVLNNVRRPCGFHAPERGGDVCGQSVGVSLLFKEKFGAATC